MDKDAGSGNSTAAIDALGLIGEETASPSSAAAIPAPPNPPVATSPSSASSAVIPQRMFETVVANELIARKSWEELEAYLCSCVANLCAKKPEDIPSIHPFLAMIPREQHFFELLSANAQEAWIYLEKYIESLDQSDSTFKPDKLETRIGRLKKKKRPFKAVLDIQNAVNDYMQLYFSRDEKAQGLWEFARRLVGTKGGRPHYRCLACQWSVPGTCSISKMRVHFMRDKDHRICPNRTPNILERIKRYDEEGGAKRKSQQSSGDDGKVITTSFPAPHPNKKKKASSATEGGLVWNEDACLSSTDSLQAHCMRSTTLLRRLEAPWRRDAMKLLTELKDHVVCLEALLFKRREGDTDSLSSDGKDLVKLRIEKMEACSKAALGLVFPPTAAHATAALQTFVEELLAFEEVFQRLKINYLRSQCRYMSPEPSVASASAKTKTTDGDSLN